MGMFAPKKNRDCGCTVDVDEYFRMSGENSYEEDENSFFYVDKSVSSNAEIQNQNTLIAKSLAQKTSESASGSNTLNQGQKSALESQKTAESAKKASESAQKTLTQGQKSALETQKSAETANKASESSQKTLTQGQQSALEAQKSAETSKKASESALKASESSLKTSSGQVDSSIKSHQAAVEKAQKETREFIRGSSGSQNSQNAQNTQKSSGILTSESDQKTSGTQNSESSNLSSGVLKITELYAKNTGNCEDGWRSFQRPSGEWCMKVFYETSIIQSAAEKRCEAQGAVLSGLQNQIESQFVFSTVTAQIYPDTGSIWVGLKRRKECLNVGWTANCTAYTSFEWTDNSATGTDGYNWACNQPDNARERSQHCVTLTASGAGNVMGFQTGLMDDVGCDFDYIKQNRKPRDIKAFVCGKKAKH
uniref:C-type lectin domain-containing protein n=1 Tax=Caenorhabditis tropicalis TaxID=1561998 RepID=A0A1I7UKL7_9PELO